MERGFKVTCFEIFRLGLSLEKLTCTIKLMPKLLYFFQLQLSKKIAYPSVAPDPRRGLRDRLLFGQISTNIFLHNFSLKTFYLRSCNLFNRDFRFVFIYSFSDSLLFPLLCFQLNFALLKYDQGQTV